MPILDEMQDLKKELNLLIKILETKNTELNNTLTKKTPILDKFISDLSNENALLQSLHKKMDDRLSASISPNSAEFDALNDAKLRKLEETYLKTTEKYAELFTSAETKLSQQVKKLDLVNAKRVKRFFLGVALTVCISVFVSVSAAYFMMRSFPVRVVVNHPENIILNESQVSLWGTDNVKVLKNTKN